MRIIFMGSPDFAVPSLNALVDAGHEVVAVYSQPPRPAGRGKGERKTAVHERAEQLGIEVRTPRTLRDEEEQAQFRALGADLAVVAAYGLILPRAILEAPKGGCINVHASLLPRWRGAAPVQRAILAGDDVSGVTIMRMEEGLDTGPMLLKRELGIRGKNAWQVTEELAKLGADALIDWLDDPTPPEPQPELGVTYAKKVDKAEARIDWTQAAEQIERQVRAFAPQPGAWFEANGERVKVFEAQVETLARHSRESGNPASFDAAEEERDPSFRGGDGLVLDDMLLIKCGEGAIRPALVQRAGRAAMTPGELLRGFAIPVGTILQ
ncbi:MAG: methionyl-tRNA formyltransferase [Sphingomicrobium sp.]